MTRLDLDFIESQWRESRGNRGSEYLLALISEVRRLRVELGGIGEEEQNWRDYARFDWLVADEDVGEDGSIHAPGDVTYVDWFGTGTTACGLVSEHLAIPGMGDRMGAPRCEACCEATGLPKGVGSPKNDDACRAVLGITPVTTNNNTASA